MPLSKPFTALVCKRKDSPYKVTEPSRYWIKVKNSQYSQLEGRKEPCTVMLSASEPTSIEKFRAIRSCTCLARQV